MGKVSNVIAMASLLSGGRKYSVDELANILEVTPRMIRIYKDELEKSGIYIDTIRGPYGGYVLNQTIRIPARKFNNHDVLLMRKVADLIKDETTNKEFEILLDKIRGIYFGSKPENKELNLSGETLSKYNLLTKAIKEKRKVKILYYSYNHGETERIIHPYDMFLYKDGWGVASYCEVKKDMRHFELKRIRECQLLKEKF